MSAVVSRVAGILDIAIPPNGGILLRKGSKPCQNRSSVSSASPALGRQSLIEPFSALFSTGKKELSKAEKR